MDKIISLITFLVLILSSAQFLWAPTMTVDAGTVLEETSSRANGFLYGIAESGVPSKAMTDSIDISSVSQKVPDGLQHPVGDVENVSEQLDECDYIVIYLQDCFDTWYYCHEEIFDMRAEGTYNWQNFVENEYLPKVKESVEFLSKQDYADRLVYCIYNEPDNGIWFGDYIDGNCSFTQESRINFYTAWKMTYELVKSIVPDALIGGPGYCDYDTDKTTGFMTYCKENNCVPEIMIYHELNPWSIPDWQTHVDDYRRIEESLGVEKLPIIVTEYGCMEDCGDPSKMIHYVAAIEKSGVWGNVAFWRLANNLNDTSADDNSPNSNWWLYRKYAKMEGNLLGTEVDALFGRKVYDDDWKLPYTGLASMNSEKDKIEVICKGSKNKRVVKLINLDETQMEDLVNVKIECVYYEGLTGVVNEPYVIKEYTAKPANGKLNINIEGIDPSCVYFVTVTPAQERTEKYVNTNLPVRYEFEKGKLTGTAYTYDSAYATSGELQGMVGGFEHEGDGVKLDFIATKSGMTDLKLIFGNSNDGSTPNDRDFTKAIVKIDGEEQIVSFPNTIKSEYTSSLTLQCELKAGKHTIEFYHLEGTFVLDSMLVSATEETDYISVLDDSNDGSKFLAVAPVDGFYEIETGTENLGMTLDEIETTVNSGDLVYLRRGLNEISFNKSSVNCKLKVTDKKGFAQSVTPENMHTSETAFVTSDKYGNEYLDGITSEDGKASFSVVVPEKGDYRVTVTYANNSEGGYHSYNVDLIERYVTVWANSNEQDVFCRNTYSNYNYKTVTFNLSLEAGENQILLSNSGKTKFNNMDSCAPLISQITVNQAVSK